MQTGCWHTGSRLRESRQTGSRQTDRQEFQTDRSYRQTGAPDRQELATDRMYRQSVQTVTPDRQEL